MQDAEQLTQLLWRWRQGDRQAADQLWTVVYQELRRLAGYYMGRERQDHTLQPTALVHEVFLRLFTSGAIEWQDRAHFFAVAARQIRHLLLNHARDLAAQKRGGKRIKLSLTHAEGLMAPMEQDLLYLDDALHRLHELDPRASQVVELRFFGGLTEAEAAEVLGISVATVKRDWDFARPWLLNQLLPLQ